ncbi:MAG: transposase [Moorea sp. SIO4G3]|nr:transposase [Moorena sp. SIO4G3]
MMATDQGRFGRLGEVRGCWCPPGIRPVVCKQQVRQYIYAYAAVAPALGKMTSLILPYANTKMMNLFLKQVSEDFGEYLIMHANG